MSKDQTGWIVLFALALMLIVIGFQGNLGVLIAILFSPTHVELSE